MYVTRDFFPLITCIYSVTEHNFATILQIWLMEEFFHTTCAWKDVLTEQFYLEQEMCRLYISHSTLIPLTCFSICHTITNKRLSQQSALGA